MSLDEYKILNERRSRLRFKAVGYGILAGITSLCLRSPFIVPVRTADLNINIYMGRYLITAGSTAFYTGKSLHNLCKSTTTTKRLNYNRTGYLSFSSICDDENEE